MPDAKEDNVISGLPAHLKRFAEDTDKPFNSAKFIEEVTNKPEYLVDPQSTLLALTDELKGVKIQLQSRLIDLLNSNYKDFVGLPAKLTGTSDSVDMISRELVSIRRQVAEVHAEAGKVVEKFKGAKQARQEIHKRKETLMLLQLAHSTRGKLEGLLDAVEEILAKGGNDERKESPIADAKENEKKQEGKGEEDLDEEAAALERYLRLARQKAAQKQMALKLSAFNDDHEPEPVVPDAKQQWLGRVTTMLEQCARHLAILSVAVAKTKGFDISDGISRRLPQFSSRLDTLLSRAFILAVRSGDSQQTSQCLRAFTFADKTDLAEETLRDIIVRPIIQCVLSRENFLRIIRLNSRSPSRRTTARNTDSSSSTESSLAPVQSAAKKATSLQQLFGILIEALNARIGVALRGATFPLTGFNFTAHSVAEEVLPAIEKNGGAELFAPYIPQRFLSHYRSAQGLLRALDDLCPDSARRDVLRRLTSVLHFEGKWSLPVYFQLRFQELRKPLETAVGSPPEEPKRIPVPVRGSGTEAKFLLKASRAVFSGVKECWKPDVWIDKLTHRFFKASVQLLRRYATWATKGVGGTSISSPSDRAKARGGGSSWTPALSVARLLALEVDLQALADGVESELLPLIIRRIVSGAEDSKIASDQKEIDEIKELVRGGFKDVVSELRSARLRCVESISIRVSRDCSAGLVARVPRIKQKYSMTGNAPPTEASDFISTVLDPLRQQLKVYRDIVGDDDKEENKLGLWLVKRVGELVAQRYCLAVEELLQVVQKTEAILTRLKKKKSANKSTGTLSDADKIRLQLWLDVKKLSEELSSLLGSPPAAMEKLQDLVKLPATVVPPQ
eukprot:CAMPEP_0197526952 /NCGR_PEP_ID=MMETSP1318-20131121/19861_1 /TAXON_ID=552666 /ORGANISM="Partenskyella glossopodia, Strain RCC365" /LENGTH=846 /DNA_ID=CAMNT_0043081359 /DNA_START=83 /DNA_END=2623 /DNA_ORIENTATION=-